MNNASTNLDLNHVSLWGVIDISMTHWNYFRGHFSYLLNGRNWAFCPFCLTIHQVLTYFTKLSWFCGEISSQEVQHGEWGRDFKFKKTCIWTTYTLLNIIIAKRVDSWLEHWTLACGNTVFENQEEERCNEEEHEVEGNYPILGEDTEKESKERRYCFTLETTKELAVSQVSHSLKKKQKSSSFPLRRAKKIPWNLEVVSFFPLLSQKRC